MLNHFKKILVASAIAATSAPAISAGFTPGLQILGLDVGDSGTLFIRLSGNTECGSAIVFVPNSAPYYKDVLALSSMAYTANQTVRVWVASCNAANQANVVRLVVGSVW